MDHAWMDGFMILGAAMCGFAIRGVTRSFVGFVKRKTQVPCGCGSEHAHH